MYKLSSTIVLLLCITTFSYSQHQCGLQEYRTLLTQQDQQYTQELKTYQAQLKTLQHKGTQSLGRGSNDVLTIPVVVHIIHTGQEIGQGSNLLENKIWEQLSILNADFRRQNMDAAFTPDEFEEVAADTRIEFCLAAKTPNGESTTGILRHSYPEFSDRSYIENYIKLETQWNPDLYLNIWIVKIPANNFGEFTVGYSYYPVPSMVGSVRDGVVLDYRFVGLNPTHAATGRTATHEIGHYLGLSHVWENTSGQGGCAYDDGISDTPIQSEASFLCPSHPKGSCGSNDMFMNFMDYVNDDCSNLFTNGQAQVMRTVLSGGIKVNGVDFADRSCLLSNASVACQPNSLASPSCCSDIVYAPVSMGFEQGEQTALWTIENANLDSNQTTPLTWLIDQQGTNNVYGAENGKGCLVYQNNTNQASANDWLFTPCMQLKSGNTYSVAFSAAILSALEEEQLQLSLHSSPSSQNIVKTLYDFLLTDAYPNYKKQEIQFVAPSTGSFHLGFNIHSNHTETGLLLDNISIKDQTSSSVSTQEELYEPFKVYPNPSRGLITLELDFPKPRDMVHLEILNAIGQQVYQRNFENVQSEKLLLHLSSFSNGFYTIRIQTDQQQISKKIVLAKP
ncbi:MAG: T9SS type A sorting domain-containing protein [Aureispira sp.]|nr:T9SS type A sorting domain-containing protein [Aureispira sp.]